MRRSLLMKTHQKFKSMTRLSKKYREEVVLKMKQFFGYKNNLAIPKVDKVTINIGTSRAIKEPKLLDIMQENLASIAGQKSVLRYARKSVSGFNVKEGMVVGLKVTLRGKRMEEFLDKLINITLPRVRDFRGLSIKSFDEQGNLTIGFKECSVFPEIDPNKVEVIHGLEVCISTTAGTREEGIKLLKLLGFPLVEKES
ncbi:MAG: large subunit ribosomal protein L5 [Parcubacteria group bacterium LiPW_72]|nr:MAG: large subunit ribosomal protein L5 [Parcubacteria group bacterium LiPW_72]